MDNLLTMEAVHEAVVVYHQWWMSAAFWTCVGVGVLGAVLLVGGVCWALAWAYHAKNIGSEAMGTVELLVPGGFLLMIDVPLWIIYGAMRLFGFQ